MNLVMMKKYDLVAKLIFIDLIGSVVEFPLWWYSTGLLLVVDNFKQILNYRYKQYAFGVWIKNFFVPMYGQFDLTGRLISVFMRIVIIGGRFVALILEGVVYFLMLILWLVFLPVLLVLIAKNFI